MTNKANFQSVCVDEVFRVEVSVKTQFTTLQFVFYLFEQIMHFQLQPLTQRKLKHQFIKEGQKKQEFYATLQLLCCVKYKASVLRFFLAP